MIEINKWWNQLFSGVKNKACERVLLVANSTVNVNFLRFIESVSTQQEKVTWDEWREWRQKWRIMGEINTIKEEL